jgi:hypothetical protein
MNWIRTAEQNPPSDTVVLGWTDDDGYGIYEVHDCDGVAMSWGLQYGESREEPLWWTALTEPPSCSPKRCGDCALRDETCSPTGAPDPFSEACPAFERKQSET